MDTPIITPRPDNLTVHGALQYAPVDADLYNICGRIKELDPNLRVVLHEQHAKPWVVLEKGPDGEERFVARYAELDARVLENLRYMLAVPLDKRLAALEAEEQKNNEKLGHMTEEQIDKMAHAFRDAAVKSNIIDPIWGRSYRNVKGKKGAA